MSLPFVGKSRKTASDTYQYPFGFIFGSSSYVGGKEVYQYYHAKDLTSSTSASFYIPNSLKRVTITSWDLLYGAFYNCSGLTDVTLGAGVTSIGGSAFKSCYGLASITIPDNVISIDENAFNGCTGLKSVTFGTSLASIGESAFSGCTGLTDITIPDSVTSIDRFAFRNCGGLESITLPFAGATKDGTANTQFGYIFGAGQYSENRDYIPTSLKTVTINGGNIGRYAFNGCIYLTGVTINGVSNIDMNAFNGCTKLTNVTIGSGVTNIGGNAFNGCTKLTNVTLGDDVTIIGGSAFSGCTGLTSVTIGNGVTRIGANAFNGCSQLTSVTIPNSVTSIGSNAFGGCTGLESMTLPFAGAEKDVATNSHFGYIFGATKATENENILPASLKTVTITGGTRIGNSAFYSCRGLNTVIISNYSVMSIGEYAFYYCDALTSITIGNSVKEIGVNAFYGCFALETIDFTGHLANWCEITGLQSLMTGNSGKLYMNHIEVHGRITIPNGVTSIADYAFCSCREITSIYIPDSVTNIGAGAFLECSGLTEISLGAGITKIGYQAFFGCTGLTSITIPVSVINIEYSVFYNCINLTDINYNGTIEQWNAMNKDPIWDQDTGEYTIHCSDGDIAKQ